MQNKLIVFLLLTMGSTHGANPVPNKAPEAPKKEAEASKLA
jgi:hypothetical protein